MTTVVYLLLFYKEHWFFYSEPVIIIIVVAFVTPFGPTRVTYCYEQCYYQHLKLWVHIICIVNSSNVMCRWRWEPLSTVTVKKALMNINAKIWKWSVLPCGQTICNKKIETWLSLAFTLKRFCIHMQLSLSLPWGVRFNLAFWRNSTQTRLWN